MEKCGPWRPQRQLLWVSYELRGPVRCGNRMRCPWWEHFLFFLFPMCKSNGVQCGKRGGEGEMKKWKADSEDNTSDKFCWKSEQWNKALTGKGWRVKYEFKVWDRKNQRWSTPNGNYWKNWCCRGVRGVKFLRRHEVKGHRTVAMELVSDWTRAWLLLHRREENVRDPTDQ